MASAPPPLPPRKPNVVKNTPYYHANLQDLEDVSNLICIHFIYIFAEVYLIFATGGNSLVKIVMR